MRRDALAAAALIALLLGVAYLAARPTPPSAATRSSRDAGFGGYAAWYELERREGVDVARFRRRHDALAADAIDTLVVAFPAPGVASLWNANEAGALDRWVRRGGRAVLVGAIPPPRPGPAGARDVPATAHAGALRGPWAALVRTLDVDARGARRLAVPRGARVLLADAAGPLVVRVAHGAGSYLAVASAAPFENRRLVSGDDARLAALLARPAHAGGSVAFDEAVRGDVVERPWYEALDDAERLALAIAALAAAAWLLSGIVPLGPAVALRTPREPTSAELVEAYGALYARAMVRDHARDALLHDARRRLESAPRTPEMLALVACVDAAAGGPVLDDAALVADARLAHRIRKETSRGSTADRTRPALTRWALRGRRRR
jgi:hypothetical protein